MIYFYIAFFTCAFLFSFLINALFLRFAHTLGIRDKKETIIRWANTSKPALGGISFYIVFLISLASYSMFFQAQEVLWNKKVVGLLGTATLAFMMGLSDDAYNTKPLLKLFVQILCGVILCYSGIHIGIFSDMMMNYFLTIIWVVGIMNSVNMLDNMDAIASIVSIFIFSAAAILIYFSGAHNNIHFLVLIGLIGSLSGFLFFNWNPSKLYMGDTGSQVIGLMLAAIGIIYFWNDSASMNNSIFVSKQLLMVAVAYILPLADTTIVIINRLAQKTSPFVGGRDHTTHNLFYRGITEKRIAVLFGGIGFSSLVIVYIMETKISSWGIEEFSLFSIFPITVFFFLFAVTRIKKNIFNQEEKNLEKNSAKDLVKHAEKHLS
ncbi:MAG: undecaprenyl/decaprenyl-phosphate alpha-N-acetylglucosaminyl 1-phosphate transferase [Bacteroidetes bacterium]|nr:undecaprenyl/decaprenyl-phosphate alpha-N-acetylglucosaminyl 1-phosphate transferase [Bacteroidota bacterium]